MFNKTRTVIAVLTLSIAMSATAFSQTAGPATSAPAQNVPAAKIGILWLEAAIFTTNEGKREMDALQKKFDPKQTELKAMSDEIENLTKQFTAQADKLSDDEKTSRQRTIDTKTKAAQRVFEDTKSDFTNQQQDIFRRVYEKLSPVIEKYAKANALTMIIDYNPQQSNILWATETVNITQNIVDAYNVQSGIAAPISAPSAVKPAPAQPLKKPATPPKQ